MPSLATDLVKRVERLPKPTRTSEALQPLFEAISNSIHSIQAKFGNKVAEKGQIVISVTTSRNKEEVKAVVEDNGTGLDDKNFRAFCTTDTDNKIESGGKGVGRLLWLDCFGKINVESYHLKGTEMRRRSFNFRLSREDQIQNLHDKKAIKTPPSTGVTITFDRIRNNAYREKFPGRTAYVFQHFTSHFLPTFIGGRSPRITLHCGDETKHYPAELESLIHRRKDIERIETKEYGILSLTLMECDKVASADLPGTHFVHFIAHDRTVRSQKIDGKLGFKYFGPDGDRVFHACLFGEYLNKNVNQERTNFTFDDSAIEKIVNTVCIPEIEKFLAEPLDNLKEEQGKIIATIANTYPSIAFGTVNELQDHIPLGELSNDAIFGHLSRERFRRDQRQGEKVRKVLARLRGEQVDDSTFISALREASKVIEEAEQKSLAEYIVRRKVVLDFLKILIQKVREERSDSSYQREDVLHSFICPMQVNTLSGGDKKVVAAASHDLWIIDERLTFAQYFSSDIPFTDLQAAAESEERPDLLIFDKVHGLRQGDESSKVLLVEFKRPGRTSYRDDESPHQQVEGYIRRLLADGEFDVRGRPIKLSSETVFYCFVVADIIGRMDEWTYSWPRTADGRGRLYQPGHGFRGSIELIGWDSLLKDAMDRNQAFFDRAGISGKSFFSDI